MTPAPAKNRCACCAKKLTLADFACGKCQVRHCGTHRLPETHACSHDFKASGREQLTKQLTRVVGDKIEHI
jgi:predicted nucleic acid binding AN1-type Zn finger protein